MTEDQQTPDLDKVAANFSAAAGGDGPPGDDTPGDDTPGDNAEAGGVPEWLKAFPEELQQSKTLQQLKGPEAALKQIIEQEKFIGQSIRLPSDDLPEEAKLAKFKKIAEKSNGFLQVAPDPSAETGPPPTPDDYDLKGLDDIDVELFGEDNLKAYRQAFHEQGLTNTQQKNLVAKEAAALKRMTEERRAAHQKDMLALQKEWGEDFTRRVKVAATYALNPAVPVPDYERDAFRAGAVDSQKIKQYYDIAQQLKGEGAQIANQVGGATSPTLNELEARADELMEAISALDGELTAQSMAKQRKLSKEHSTIMERINKIQKREGQQ
jgi:hypothetical protein